jgi:ATP-dependent exoDNAse (exonuclease V) beta subunit
MLRVYKSSAGSGKTYTLVREYIRLAIGGSSPVKNTNENKFKHILAITFTNKAANEMKERIISTLQRIARSDESVNGLILELAVETKLPEAIIVDKAEKILRNVLHNYSDVSVSTIDSFVHRIIRAFTYDLHLPMSFEIEMDRDKLLNNTIGILMDRLSDENDQLTNAIVEFAETNIEEGKSWNLEYSLVKLAEELFNEDAYPYLERLGKVDLNEARKMRESLYKYVNVFEQKLFEAGKKAYQLIVQQGLDERHFFQTTKGIFGFFSKYANEEFPNDLTGNSYVIKTVHEDKWAGGKASPHDVQRIENIKEHLLAQYNYIAGCCEKEGKDYALAKLLLRNFYAFILLADIQKLMDEFKRDNNVLHISEFQQRVHAIVKEQEAPVIYERIGDWYENILIDEYQDTSVLQGQNLLPLIENSQFKTEDSLVVGDGKQAIYRFRNGKVEQFAMLPAVYGSDKDLLLKEREVAIGNYGTQTLHLDYNYRSRNEIIDFNNLLYDTLSALPELKSRNIYDGQAQKQGKKLSGGFISIEFLKDDEERLADEMRCARVLEIIEEVRGKGYGLKDIAVLSRSNKNAAVIASFLIEKGIDVVSSESLLIDNSPKVRLILATLQYFERKGDHIARASMVYYLHLLILKQGLRFEEFDFRSTESDFETNISQLLGREFRSYSFISYQLVDLIQELINFYMLDDVDPFLQFFIDEAILFSANNRAAVREFLDWWEEVKYRKSIVYPEVLDAVKLMTIHKSKGLQFPIVILADADWPQKNTKRNFWVELDKPWLPGLELGVLPVVKDVLQTEFKDLYEEEESQSFLDMLNLLYVATTRPEDCLYILSRELAREPAKSNSITALLVAFIKKIDKWQGFRTYRFGDEKTLKIVNGSKPGAAQNMYVRQKGLPTAKAGKKIAIRKNSQLLWSDKSREKIDRGNLIHTVMKQVKYKEDLDSVLERLLLEGTINTKEKESLEADLSALLEHPQLSGYFQKPYVVINERALMDSTGAKIPDRVLVHEKEAAVIDYKSGEKRVGDKKQLEEYGSRLSQFGFEVVRKFLVYVESKEVEEV